MSAAGGDSLPDPLIVVPSRHAMQLEICRSLGIDPKVMGLDIEADRLPGDPPDKDS